MISDYILGLFQFQFSYMYIWFMIILLLYFKSTFVYAYMISNYGTALLYFQFWCYNFWSGPSTTLIPNIYIYYFPILMLYIMIISLPQLQFWCYVYIYIYIWPQFWSHLYQFLSHLHFNSSSDTTALFMFLPPFHSWCYGIWSWFTPIQLWCYICVTLWSDPCITLISILMLNDFWSHLYPSSSFDATHTHIYMNIDHVFISTPVLFLWLW